MKNITPVAPTDTPWRINDSPYPASALCRCGHTYAAHGSKGFVCGLLTCDCKVFVPAQQAQKIAANINVDICRRELYS